MKQNTITRRIISITVSLVMLLTAFPIAAFALGETQAVQTDGVWTYLNSVLNAGRTSFTTESGKNVSMAVDGTDFSFMQTQDNEQMTFSTVFYAKKKSWNNSIVIQAVTTDLEDADYASLIDSTSWALTKGSVANDGGDDSPNGDDMKRDGFGGLMTGWTYTTVFTADGSAVYHPQWTVTYKDGSTQYTALSNAGTNPTFTIQVIDLRELNALVVLAGQRGKDVSDIISGYDLTGATYIPQDTVDSLTDAVRRRMCADYTALEAAIANAQALGANTEVLGGTIYDTTTYNAMAAVLAEALAIDRYLEDTPENNAMLASKAAELQAAVDAVVTNNLAVITYYVDGVLYATSACVPNEGYNFHDVTDHYIATPTKANATFDCWRDADGHKVKPNTPVNSSFSVYAHFNYVTGDATGPVEQLGRWNHTPDTNFDDGRGINGLTMWVENNEFHFVRTYTGQKFSFNTAVSAVRNGADRAVRLTNVVFKNSSNSFITENNITNDDIVYYNEIPGNDSSIPAKPADSASCNLPYVTGATFEEQLENSVRSWRYIYTFEAACNEGTEKVYNFDWQITYKHGTSSPSTSVNDTVPFTIKVTDLRQIIKVFAKARSVANDANSPLSPERQALLVNRVNEIDENYTFDGTEYYTQTEINNLVAELNSYIEGTDFPCDYTELDAAIAQAADIIAIGNDNNRYMSEEWQDLLDAYSAATTVDRNLIIDNNNVNQPMIDQLTEDLLYAIEALSYKTHQHAVVDTSDLEDLVDESINNEPGTNNDDGKYDDDAWNEYIDALNDAQDVIDNYPDPTYDNDNGDGQKEVDDAEQRLQDALDALNDPANQNSPCDYSALDEAIAAAESITDNDLFTPETYQALQDALTDGQNVERDLYDNGINQDIIDNATQAILGAIAALLTDAITKAENTDTTGMTPISIQNLEDAIYNGETVANDGSSTGDDMVSAIEDIISALDGLTPDKTELGQKIEEGNNTDTAGYTSDSIQDLVDAIAAGEQVFNDPDATVQEIQDAIDAIDNALDGLTADKTELEIAIYSAGIIDTTDVPQNLVEALDAAVANGQTVDGDPDASVASVENATEQIREAIANILQQVIDDASNADTTGMTTNSIQDLEDAIDNAQVTHDDADSNSYTLAEAIADVQSALNGLEPDKTDLEDAITAGESIDTTDIPQNLTDALDTAVANGQTVDADDDATVSDITTATQDIIDAIDDILEYVKDEAENTDTSGMTPDSIQDLVDAVQHAEDLLSDPDSTPEDKAEAISDLQNALSGLEEVKQILPSGSGNINVDRADTSYYYLVGLDASNTSLANVKTLLDNDGRQIVAFRNGVQLGEGDLIGTGCIIKCISIKDPTIVYEQATVILYGDVNGDGLVNNTDYDAMFNEALFGQSIEGNLFRIAGDLNNDGVIDGFDMAKLDLQLTGARPFDQTVEYYK